ncbi:MAG: hypothetical protein E6R14_04150 [Thermomicrobiales bacterium]|nr:MAG: hypothetical protein E6R14_04150 [Thermomicrobiales bacterium]
MRRVLIIALLTVLLLPLSTQAQDHQFTKGEVVIVVLASKPIRSSPSSNSGIVTTVVRGDELTIISDQPVEADGYVWWNIYFAERDAKGWLPDNSFSAKDSHNGNMESATAAECWTDDQQTEVDGVLNWTDPPVMIIDPTGEYIATIETTKGEILIELDAENAPVATNNFYCLALAGYYDGTDFHRVSADFLIQGGDPTGTGTGTPGYSVPSDPTTGAYPAGSLALANGEPNQNGAQFFITAADLTGEIPADYPVFGHVISGMEIVDEISRSPVEMNARGERSAPQDPTTITRIEVEVLADEIGPPLPSGTSVAQAATTPAAASTVAAPPTTHSSVKLLAKDIAYDPTTITIQVSDLPVTITMENTGAAEHDFVIDALDIKVTAAPGETVEIVIPVGAAAGEYQFHCSVPGHKEAGMVGTLIIEGGTTSTSGVAEASGAEATCAGVEDYANAYDRALAIAMAQNPDVLMIFVELDEKEDEDRFDTLTPVEFTVLSSFTADMATELSLVTPPAIAADWHETQVKMYELLSQMLETSAESGFLTASLLYGAEFSALERREEADLLAARGCPAFVAWATEDDDDADATWSQAFLGGFAFTSDLQPNMLYLPPASSMRE